jgi:hypothetical protein
MSEKLMTPLISLQDGQVDPSDNLALRIDEEPQSTMQENWIRGMVEMEEKRNSKIKFIYFKLKKI